MKILVEGLNLVGSCPYCGKEFPIRNADPKVRHRCSACHRHFRLPVSLDLSKLVKYEPTIQELTVTKVTLNDVWNEPEFLQYCRLSKDNDNYPMTAEAYLAWKNSRYTK